LTDLKLQHLLTLSFLLSKGAKNNFISITTSSLGKKIQKSQQAASKHLVELERDGFIERIISGRSVSVKITPKGYSELVKISKILQSSLEKTPSYIQLKGTIVSGMGEGAYYMSLRGYTKQFKKKIGYVPFPGTLNVRLEKKEFVESSKQLDAQEGILINGFSDGRRTYGWVRCFPARTNKGISCHLIKLERTHHDPTIIELISEVNIRKTSNLRDGSKITITLPTNSN